MLRMSKMTDYGILLLTHFAATPEGATCSARNLAELTHLPLPMVSKILKMLLHEGLLVSRRGASGGYRLARKPTQISVGEMIRAIEGPIAVMECIDSPGACRVEARCQVRHNWHHINSRINESVVRALQAITLFDMVQPMKEGFVPLGEIVQVADSGLPC